MARAWVAAAEGAVSQARAQARDAADVAAAQGQTAVAVHALHTAVLFGDRTVGGRLTALAREVDGPRVHIAAAHAAALAIEDGHGLDAVPVRWEGTGALLLAADAAAQASTVHQRAGRCGSALAAATRAQRLTGRCEGADTPALRSATRPLPLTGREREIATLAAAGASNRDIAERLVLSVRTVEGHLYRACTKLGITDRAALAPLLQT